MKGKYIYCRADDFTKQRAVLLPTKNEDFLFTYMQLLRSHKTR